MTEFVPRICTPTDGYERHYPRIVELANKQLETQFWTATEMVVELDKEDYLYNMTDEQRHAVLTILGLFVRYELRVGDFWQRVARIFPRPEVKLAASVIDCTERAVHAEFYDKVNKVLGLDTDEHYLAYKSVPVLAERAEWLGNLLADQEDDILATIIFSLTETVLLFSPFAELKSFQTNGYNMIPVTVRGTNQSSIDEDLHGQVSAEIINTYYAEMGTTLLADWNRYPKVVEAVHKAVEHEFAIVDLSIIGDSLNGVPKESFKKFVQHRANVFLERLGLPHEFKDTQSEVNDWFEKNTYAFQLVDFFTKGVGREYELGGWDEHRLTSAWRTK